MQHNLKKLKEDVQAVSPVVATLMLVLVAAGSAVGIGVWMSSVQDDATDGLNTNVNGDCLKLGGSTTVHPVNVQMKDLYEQTTGLCVELSQGGSGAGLRGVGIGTLDIGARSDPVVFPSSYPDFNQDGVKDPGTELHVTTIGYDAVAMITTPTNCLYADATLRAKGLTSDIVEDLYALAMDLDTSGYANNVFDAVTDPVTWEQLAEEVHDGDHTSASTPVCDGVGAIKLTDRADLGGTSEFACDKLVNDSPDVCSEDGQIPAHANIFAGTGNAGVEALFTDDLFLGFSSYGTAVLAGSLEAFPHGGVAPSTDTIKDESFPGARPLIYVTVGEPSGSVAHFIDFVRDLQRNDAVLNNIGYVSLQDTLSST